MLMNARPHYLSVTRMPFARIPLIHIFVLVNLELSQMEEFALVRGFKITVSTVSYRTLLFFARIYDHLCAWAIKSSRKTSFVAWFAEHYPK